MIKLKELLPNRYNTTQGGSRTLKPGFGPISSFSKMINLVIYDKDDGFENKKRRELFLNILGKMLKRKTQNLDYDFQVIKPDEKINNLKFYPITKKIIGIFPQYMFKKGKINFENFIYYHDLVKLFPNLEMKEKQKIQ